MKSLIPRIEFPELFFGFVAPIGVDHDAIVAEFHRDLQSRGYQVEDVKVTEIFQKFLKVVTPSEPLVGAPSDLKYKSYIKYGNQLRTEFEDDALLAATTIGQIIQRRRRRQHQSDAIPFEKTAYLLHQFKRKEEIELLRSIYGSLFFQVSAYSRRGSRVDLLARKFASSSNLGHPDKFRPQAEHIVQIDEEEIDVQHGQRVRQIFHDADFIINLDNHAETVAGQVNRFLEILFSSNSISPTKMEYEMFAAKAAALRTLDVSRQVGAAIFTTDGEVVALGSNEVPMAGGGTYWSGSTIDARDYRSGFDSNFRRKKQMLGELVQALQHPRDLQSVINDPAIRESQFMDALEYGRAIHAEMCAICDAARLGRALKGTVLSTTTFPCHLCAKHIVAAGIARVVFLEPYPKSLAFDLHADSLEIEGGDRGGFDLYPSVKFEHFFGVTPRRYRELFERGQRKNDDGDFLRYVRDTQQPLMDIKVPFYFMLSYTRRGARGLRESRQACIRRILHRHKPIGSRHPRRAYGTAHPQ